MVPEALGFQSSPARGRWRGAAVTEGEDMARLAYAETPPPPLACGERSPSPAKAREDF